MVVADGTVVLVFRIDRAEDKILVPWCVHPSQVFNLVRSTARDVYYRFFHDPGEAERHLTKKRFTKRAEACSEFQSKLFTFLYENRFELPFLMGIASAEFAKEIRADADDVDIVTGDAIGEPPLQSSTGSSDGEIPPASSAEN